MVNYLVLVKKLGRELIEFESKLWLNYIGNLVEDCRKFIDKVEQMLEIVKRIQNKKLEVDVYNYMGFYYCLF